METSGSEHLTKRKDQDQESYDYVSGLLLKSLGETISEADRERIANALLNTFELSPGTDCLIEPITSGFSLSARLFLLTIDGVRYVLRLTEVAENPENRDWEVAVSRHMGNEKIAPAVHYASPDDGIIITNFIDEQMPKWSERFSEKMAAKLAMKLRVLHGSPASAIKPNHEISASGLPNDSRARVNGIVNRENGFYLQAFAMKMLDVLEPFMENGVLAHHDLHMGNILYDGDEFWLIDLEHAGAGDPYLDLVVICHITSFCTGMEPVFLKHYFGGELSRIEEHKLYLAKIVSTLRYSISSFSNCEDYPRLLTEDVFPICKYTDYTPDIDGPVDLSLDQGKYWQSVALLKQALDYLAAPGFPEVMFAITGSDALLADDPETPQDELPTQLSESTLLALARLLRAISSGELHPSATKSNATWEQFEMRKASVVRRMKQAPVQQILSTYDRLADLLAPFSEPVFCHFSLHPSKLRYKKEGGYEQFWVTDWEDAATGYKLFDLASVVNHLELSGRQEQFLLLCYFGSRIIETNLAYFYLVKQLAWLRAAINMLSSFDEDQLPEAMQIGEKALGNLNSAQYKRSLHLLRQEVYLCAFCNQ